MPDPIRIRAQSQGDKVMVRALVTHEMESGQRKDAAGKTVPAWWVQQVVIALNGRVVMTANWGTSVAKNPFLQFTLRAGKVGDKLAISWVDSRGERRTDETTVVA
jgi:sulfur-oxidizing protein SoxZ